MEKTIITINREYGSGGNEIAKLVSERLQIGLYDKERLVDKAKREGIFDSVKSFYNERPIDSLLYAIAMDTLPEKVSRVPFQMIEELAEKESCVIVGRCSNYILRDKPGTLRVFVHSNLEKRIEKIAKGKKLTKEKAAEKIRQIDRERSSFYRFYTESDWEDLVNYDLVLDSSTFGIEGCVAMIQNALELKED